jgi:hypothetical protein
VEKCLTSQIMDLKCPLKFRSQLGEEGIFLSISTHTRLLHFKADKWSLDFYIVYDHISVYRLYRPRRRWIIVKHVVHLVGHMRYISSLLQREKFMEMLVPKLYFNFDVNQSIIVNITNSMELSTTREIPNCLDTR